ncbi:hypothetical protein ABK040_012895 [Willaertia magna]
MPSWFSNIYQFVNKNYKKFKKNKDLNMKANNNGSNNNKSIINYEALYYCGDNQYHQIPFPNNADSTEEKVIPIDLSVLPPTLVIDHHFNNTSPQKDNYIKEIIKKIICGSYYIIIITTKGNIYSAGQNTFGGCGTATTESTNGWQRILENVTILDGETGFNHTVLYDNNLNLWVFGYNGYGNLGDDTTTNSLEPKKLDYINLEKGDIVKCGGFFTMILKNCKRRIITCGSNSSGQLGDSNLPETVKTFQQINLNHTLAKDDFNYKIKKISPGGYFTCLLTESGIVYYSGRNETTSDYLKDFNGTSIHDFKKIELVENDKFVFEDVVSGYNYFVLKDFNYNFYIYGSNTDGQLGGSIGRININNIKRVFTNLRSTSSYLLTNDDKIYVAGYNSRGQLAVLNLNINVNTFTESLQYSKLMENHKNNEMDMIFGAFFSIIVFGEKERDEMLLMTVIFNRIFDSEQKLNNLSDISFIW